MPRGVPRIPEPREWILKKKCNCCGQTKAWAHFSPMQYWDDGSVRRVYSYCKECDSARGKERKRKYRQENLERLNAYNVEWKRRQRALRRSESAVNSERIPSRPLQVLLWTKLMEMEEPAWADLASQCGLPERSVRRVLTQANVSYQLADKVCTAFGARVDELWDENDPEELAA